MHTYVYSHNIGGEGFYWMSGARENKKKKRKEEKKKVENWYDIRKE